MTLVTLVTRNRTLEKGDYVIMESDTEKETRVIREFWESLTPKSLDELLKEIAETPIPFIDYEPIPKARRTRKKS